MFDAPRKVDAHVCLDYICIYVIMSKITFHTDSGFATLKPSRSRELSRAPPPDRRTARTAATPAGKSLSMATPSERARRAAQAPSNDSKAGPRRARKKAHRRLSRASRHKRPAFDQSMQPKLFVLGDVCTYAYGRAGVILLFLRLQ